MSDQVSMEHAAVRSFMSQLQEHLSSHTSHYTSTHGEITARIANYKGDGGSGAQALLPILDEHHTSMVNTLTSCHEVLNSHLTTNTAADAQQADALKRAQTQAASTITSSLT
jgi:uncharacterized protein YukE